MCDYSLSSNAYAWRGLNEPCTNNISTHISWMLNAEFPATFPTYFVRQQFLSSSLVPCSIIWTKGNGNRMEIANASFYSQTAILLYFTLVGNTALNTWEWGPWHQHWEAKSWGLPESQFIIWVGTWLCLCFPSYTITMQNQFSQGIFKASLMFCDTTH